jgi:aminopeptidase N
MVHSTRKFFVAVLLFCFVSTTGVAGKINSNAFDVEEYRIEMDWSKSLTQGNHYFTGKVAALVRVDTSSLNAIIFHARALEIDSIKVNATAVTYELALGRLMIFLNRPYSLGEQLSIEIHYTHPDSSRRYRGYYFEPPGVDRPEPIAFTSSVPFQAHTWYPCYDSPDDKALLEVIVTVPSSYLVVSNGILVSQNASKSGEQITFHWRETHPIWTSTVFVAASKYGIFTRSFVAGNTIKEARLYIWPEDSAGTQYDALRSFETIIDVLEFYSNRFLSYPFDNLKVAVTGRASVVSNQTVIQAGRDIFHISNVAPGLWPHEIAHQWFGNYVNARAFNELWLNEGFAAYSDALYTEHQHGNAALRTKMNEWARFAIDNDARLVNPPDPYHLAIYFKGACMLDMLRYCLGDSIFWTILNVYLNRFDYQAASTEDFIGVVEEVAKADYGWFFAQWAYQTGFPVYNITWNSHELGDEIYEISLDVTQTQSGTDHFTMPLLFNLHTARGDTTVSFINNSRAQNFVFLVYGKPEELTFDKENRILLKRINSITNVTDKISALPRRFDLAQNHPNPFSTSTVIGFDLPEFSNVSLEIYNLLGQRVRILVTEKKPAGSYQICWDGRDDVNASVANGVYVYRFRAGKLAITRKALLLR